MTLPVEILSILVLVAVGLAGLAVFLLLSSTPRGGRRLSESRQAVAMLGKHEADIVKLQRALRGLIGEQRRQAEVLLSTVQRVGLVRYDAFEDMGGHLSFSAALLDAGGSGLMITSINSRQDTRCYARVIQNGTSGQNLTSEEREAIRRAMEQPKVPAPVPISSGRRRGRLLRSGS